MKNANYNYIKKAGAAIINISKLLLLNFVLNTIVIIAIFVSNSDINDFVSSNFFFEETKKHFEEIKIIIYCLSALDIIIYIGILIFLFEAGSNLKEVDSEIEEEGILTKS